MSLYYICSWITLQVYIIKADIFLSTFLHIKMQNSLIYISVLKNAFILLSVKSWWV